MANFSHRGTVHSVLLASASLLTFAISAHAQAPEQSGVADIIVTAQKRQENLQDVPLAISALSQQALENRGVTGLNSLQTAGIPGVQIQPGGGQQNTLEVQIRGASTSSTNDAGRESSTAIYLDDVYQPRAQGAGLTLADPERIEVLRGPQGQLFGRGAAGGALRIVSAAPTGKLGGRVTVAYGNYDAQKYEAHLNLPAFANLALKLDGIIDKHDGYTKNPKSPNIARSYDFNMRDDKGFRVSGKWTPSDDFSLIYAFNHLDSTTTAEYEVALPRPASVPSLPLPTPEAQAYYGYLSAPIWRGPTPIASSRPSTAWAPFYNHGFFTRSWQHSLRGEYQANDHLTIRSITGMGLVKVDSVTQNSNTISMVLPSQLGNAVLNAANFIAYDEPVVGIPTGARVYAFGGAGMQTQDLRSKFFSQELQLVGSFDEHEWVAGLYYSDEKIRQKASSPFDIAFYDPNNTGAAVVKDFSTYAIVNPFFLSPAAKAGLDTEVNSKSFAIFAQETWTPEALDNKLHLTAGIRYTDDQKSGVRLTDGQAVPNTILTNIALRNITEKRFDPAATISYDLTPDNNIYFRYSRAYKAGGYNLTGAALIVGGVPQVINFGAEQNTSFELGSKNEFFNRRLRLNVVAFMSRIRNQQLNVFAAPPGGVTPVSQTINAPGITKTRGVEVESSAVLAPGLTLNLNYAYLHQKLPPIPASIDPAVALPTSPTSSPAIYYPSNSPRHTVSGSLDYETALASVGTFYVHLDAARSSLFRTTNRQSQFNYLTPRRLNSFNGRIGIRDVELGMTKLNLSAYMNNITNNNARQHTAGFGDVFFMPPRTYGLQLTAAF